MGAPWGVKRLLAGLPLGGDRTHLNEAETQSRHGLEVLPVFIKAGGQADGVVESEAEQFPAQSRMLKAVNGSKEMADARDGKY